MSSNVNDGLTSSYNDICYVSKYFFNNDDNNFKKELKIF